MFDLLLVTKIIDQLICKIYISCSICKHFILCVYKSTNDMLVCTTPPSIVMFCNPQLGINWLPSGQDTLGVTHWVDGQFDPWILRNLNIFITWNKFEILLTNNLQNHQSLNRTKKSENEMRHENCRRMRIFQKHNEQRSCHFGHPSFFYSDFFKIHKRNFLDQNYSKQTSRTNL